MVENLPFLIFLVFLVLFYYFCVEVFVQLLLCYNNPCCGMISRVWGNHQKIFDFLLREEDEVVKLVLFLINIFLLVVAVITFLGILLASSHSESGGPFLLSLLYWLSKQATILSRQFCSMVDWTWPKMAFESVHVCVKAFIILVPVWSLLVFRSSSILAMFEVATIAFKAQPHIFGGCKPLDLVSEAATGGV